VAAPRGKERSNTSGAPGEIEWRNSAIDSGEVYDFEFQPEITGEMALEVSNVFGDTRLTGAIVVQ